MAQTVKNMPVMQETQVQSLEKGPQMFLDCSGVEEMETEVSDLKAQLSLLGLAWWLGW